MGIRKAVKLLAAVCAALFLTIAAPVQKAHAINGIGVSPAIKDLVIGQSDAEKTFLLKIANHDSIVQTVKLTALDFGSLDESGGLVFIGTPQDPGQTKYGLTSWLSFDNDTVTLQPGEYRSVTVTITNKTSLAPGGHYAAIIVRPVDEDQETDKNQVQLVPSTSSLVLVRKQGGDIARLSLNSVAYSGPWARFPSQINIRFQNSGNVHVVPRGIVILKDPRGVVVAKGIVNTGSGTILPESFRVYPTQLAQVGNPWLPGRYSIEVQSRFDGQDGFSRYSTSFWYAGNGPLSAVAAIVVLSLTLIGVTQLLHAIRRKHAGPNDPKA